MLLFDSFSNEHAQYLGTDLLKLESLINSIEIEVITCKRKGIKLQLLSQYHPIFIWFKFKKN